MGKLSDAEKQEILQSNLKGYRIARSMSVDSASRTAGAEESTPDYKTLRERFLSEEELSEEEEETTAAAKPMGRSANDAFADAAAEDNDDDVEIVPIEKESGADPWNRGARPKAVVMSRKDKKIIGSQG